MGVHSWTYSQVWTNYINVTVMFADPCVQTLVQDLKSSFFWVWFDLKNRNLTGKVSFHDFRTLTAVLYRRLISDD